MNRFSWLLASLLRILGMLTMASVLAAVGVTMFQDSLLYFPERTALGELAVSPAGTRLTPWPAGDEFRGLLAEPVGGAVRGTVIVFHGNAGHAGHRLFYAEMLNPLGWRVLLAEYPGYGSRDGNLGEASLVADAAATITLAQRDFGATVLLGESLGAGVATAASAHVAHRGVPALLLITPWDTLTATAAHHYPWLPVRWLLRDRYDSAANLQGYPGRVTVIVAERDSIVPAMRGRALHGRLPAGQRLLSIADAGHNDWPDHVDAAWWRGLMADVPPH